MARFGFGTAGAVEQQIAQADYARYGAVSDSCRTQLARIVLSNAEGLGTSFIFSSGSDAERVRFDAVSLPILDESPAQVQPPEAASDQQTS